MAMVVTLSPDEAQSIDLDLGDNAVVVTEDGKTQEVIRNLSGAAIIGKHVYLANDEGRELLQLTRTAPRRYEDARLVKLTDLFDIATETNKKEFDLEALAVDRIDKNRTRLWLIGSHAMGHAKPEDKNFKLKQLGLKRERNRLIFGCVDIGADGPIPGSGRHLPIRSLGEETHTTDFLDALRAAPPSASGLLREVAALTNLDIPDAVASRIGWFTPYTMASTKENGLDVEGLAIRRRNGDDTRVVALVGLRGPVIDGRAVLVEVEIRDRNNARALKLVGEPRFHLLGLDGFGIRDLEWRGSDLLILAGPTMTRQKESALFRWNDAWKAVNDSGKSVAEVDDIELLGVLPMPEKRSGPEVLTTVTPGEPEYMLLRDGIGADRLRDAAGKPSCLGPIYHSEVYRVAD